MHMPLLWDLDQRIKMMNRCPRYPPALTLSMPVIEFLGDEDETPELARLANDGMHEIVQKHGDLFPAFVASLPMNNVPAALAEMDRAIAGLGAKGVQIFTNVNGRPLDDPEFFRIFERMTKTYDLPVWVHPTRTAKFADYASEEKSKYEIWWLFGWPYETSAFMARLVFSGMLDKLPKLKIITHHLGAMAPFFVNRIGYGMDQFGARTADEDYESLLRKSREVPGASRLLRDARQASEAERHHPPPRRHGAFLRQPHRLRHGPVRRADRGRRLRSALKEDAEAAGRLLQDVLRRHLDQRLEGRDPVW